MSTGTPLRGAVLAAALLLASAVHGGYDEGLRAARAGDHALAKKELLAALEAKDMRAAGVLAIMALHGSGGARDPAEALRLATLGAEAGDRVSMNLAADMLIRGIGRARDLAAGRDWARRSAAAGDATGRVLLYFAFLVDPGHSPVAGGNPPLTPERYRALATRPLAARAVEIEALDALARAADQLHGPANTALAAYFADKIGPPNHARAAAMFARFPGIRDVSDYEGWLDALKSRGTTLATPRLYRDVENAALPLALKQSGRPDCGTVRIEKLARLGELRGASYLPLTHALLNESYLIAGQWDEAWTLDACGAPVDLRVRFEADGLGSATFALSPAP